MKKLISSVILGVMLTSCGDDGGNGGGAPGYTHKELAVKFVEELNLDAEFNVELIKKSTDQKDFIVIYDPLYDSYDAIDIENYDPGLDSAVDYYFRHSASFYYDLDEIPKHTEYDTRDVYVEYEYYDEFWDEWVTEGYWTTETVSWVVPTKYRDRYSGLYFEKVEATKKDLAKVAALKETYQIEKSAQFLSSEYGLSLNRGKEVAKLVTHWNKASKKSMTNAEIDTFSTELLGFSLTSGKEAVTEMVSGDDSKLEELVEQAATTNGITPEHATKLMTKIFKL